MWSVVALRGGVAIRSTTAASVATASVPTASVPTASVPTASARRGKVWQGDQGQDDENLECPTHHSHRLEPIARGATTSMCEKICRKGD